MKRGPAGSETMDEPPLGRLSTLIGFDVRGTIEFYRIELTHRRKIMRGRSIAAAVVIAGIAIGVSSIAGAHEDHDKASAPTAFTSMTPILNVASVEASIEHYTSVLGFNKDWDWPAEEEDKTFASISNGEVHVFLSENSQGTRPVWIYYHVGDVDKLHQEYVAAAAKIKKVPVDEPWGMREMLVEDLDGHVLRIGGLPSEEGHGESEEEHNESE